MATATTTSSPPVLLTMAQFCQKHPWMKMGGLKGVVLRADKNGFAPCIWRFGRKVLLEEARVFEWLRERGAQPAPTKVA